MAQKTENAAALAAKTGVEEKKQTSAEKKAEKKFSLAVLKRSSAELFGISGGAFAVASAGLKARKYSVNEMKSHIEKWLKQEVKR